MTTAGAGPPDPVDPGTVPAATTDAGPAEPAGPRPADRSVPTGRRARRWTPPLLAAVLLATGAGAFIAGSGLSGASAQAVAGNVPLNPGAADDLDISARNSPTLVRNPRRPDNVVVLARIDAPRFGCELHLSFDAGATWMAGEIPFPAGEEDPPRCFAPDAAFGADGTLHVSFVTLAGLGNTPNALWVASSADGGRTLTTPVRVAGRLTFQPRISTDPSRPGSVYLSWVQADSVGFLLFSAPGNPVMVARSEDGGKRWADARRATPPARSRVVAPSTAVGHDGQVFLLYLDLRDDVLDYHGAHEGRGGEPYPGLWQLVLARSTDGGRTWRETTVEDAVVPTQRVVVFIPPSPSLAVDGGSGRVYVAFHDGRLGDADVWVWASSDGGGKFAPPTRVNDTPPGDGTSQYLPELAIAPGGRLDVVYYDRRGDGRDVMNQVSFQSSGDGGRSFGRRVTVSDVAFDSRIGFLSDRGLPDLGSRLGLVSLQRRALAVWADTRGGTVASGKQDLARGVVVLESGSPLRSPLRVGGALLLAAGGVTATATLVRRCRRDASGKRQAPGADVPAEVLS